MIMLLAPHRYSNSDPRVVQEPLANSAYNKLRRVRLVGLERSKTLSFHRIVPNGLALVDANEGGTSCLNLRPS